jgi:hypothetical protein
MTYFEKGMSIVRETRKRRIAYAITGVVLAILIVVPEPHVARAKLLPQDSSSAGLGQILNSLGGQLGSFASLLSGGRPPNDLYLVIGRSDGVADDVIQALKLAGPQRSYASVREAKVALARKVDVHLLLGGVLEVETTTHDAANSVALTSAYVTAISNRIGQLGRQTIKSKTAIVARRFEDARMKVVQTETALQAFRSQNRLAEPEIQLGSELSLRAQQQAQLQAKTVELQVMQQTAGPDNPALQAVQGEVAALRAQIGQSERPTLGAAGPNVSGLSVLQNRYLNLFRDYRFAQALYEVYSRASEQVAVENMVAESATYIQLVEPAHLDADRHYNISAIALFSLLVLIILFSEVYVPLTGLRWVDVTSRDQGAL